jgi:hypothetical protein
MLYSIALNKVNLILVLPEANNIFEKYLLSPDMILLELNYL